MPCFCPESVLFQLNGQIQVVFCPSFFIFRKFLSIRNGKLSILPSCNIRFGHRAVSNLFTVLQQRPFYIKIVQIQEIILIINRNLLSHNLFRRSRKPDALILIFYLPKFRLGIPVRRNQSVYTEGTVIRRFSAVAAISIVLPLRLFFIEIFMGKIL